MEKSLARLMYAVTIWMYRHYSRKSTAMPGQKVAWVSSFAPVELLEAMHVAYVYPESYAAVVAASGKEQQCLAQSERNGLSLDCCSYSTSFNGCLGLGVGPRGQPPKPDLLVVANNQCTTLLNWWNLLSASMEIPLVVLDYPGGSGQEVYLYQQHIKLVGVLERLTGSVFSQSALDACVETSRANVELWNQILEIIPNIYVKPGFLFDSLAPLIGARCRRETNEYYTALLQELQSQPGVGEGKRVYWAGYPFWYHPDRCLLPEGARMVGANYASFWNLRFDGGDCWERLANAYNNTWLNKPYTEQRGLILDGVSRSGAQCVIINRNKSCKRDFVSFSQSDCQLPSVMIESDMIDRGYLNREREYAKIRYLASLL
jgi:benzoyl-CoA reductase/2-hydroxyglutaryl-CoA dehydratase subunit BcrC/BadD/HgdB